jgi:Tripartite ATP-independent periplasmic transporter, DctM component
MISCAGRRGVLAAVDRSVITANRFVIAALLAIMTLLVFGNVVLRYGFGSSLPWVEEATRYMGTPSPLLAAQRMFSGIDSFPLMAVPFFILAAELMTGGGSPTSSSGSPPRSSATSAAGSATPTCSCRSSSPVSAARPWPTRPARARSSFG